MGLRSFIGRVFQDFGAAFALASMGDGDARPVAPLDAGVARTRLDALAALLAVQYFDDWATLTPEVRDRYRDEARIGLAAIDALDPLRDPAGPKLAGGEVVDDRGQYIGLRRGGGDKVPDEPPFVEMSAPPEFVARLRELSGGAEPGASAARRVLERLPDGVRR